MTENPSNRPETALQRVPADQTWSLQRVLPHPSSSIYRAFMDPRVLPRWFGPRGWSVRPETVELEARPGGARRFVMLLDEDPEQGAPFHGRHAAIVPQRLVEIHESLPGPDGEPTEHLIVLRVELEPLDGGTRLSLRQGPLPQDVHATARAAWESSLDRLRALLDAEPDLGPAPEPGTPPDPQPGPGADPGAR